MKSSSILYSKLKKHEDWRWDSEFLCDEPCHNKKLTYKPIGEILSLSQYGISTDMNESGDGCKIYRMNEISDMFCDREINKYAEITSGQISKFRLKDNDVLFNRTNSLDFVGRTGIFKKFSEENLVFASYLIRVRTNETEILPEYLTTFLNTKYGIQDAKRRARISINQSNINAEELKRVEIPVLSKEIQNTIRDIFKLSFQSVNKSESLYKEAEEVFLFELGLLSWKPKHRLSFIKDFSDTQSADRIDAEYFQPMYEEIIKTLKANFKAKPIGEYDFIDVTTGQYSDEYVSPSEGKPYIRGTDLSKGTVATESLVYIERKKQVKSKIAREGDVVVTRVGTIGLSARIPKECDGGTTSDNLIRLRFDNKILNSDYTALYLGSIIGRSLMIGYSRGSVQQRLNQETLKEIIFPIPRINIQNEIAGVVSASNVKRKESKLLLNIAKRGVEMAIEKSEKDAQRWMEAELKKLGITQLATA